MSEKPDPAGVIDQQHYADTDDGEYLPDPGYINRVKHRAYETTKLPQSFQDYEYQRFPRLVVGEINRLYQEEKQIRDEYQH